MRHEVLPSFICNRAGVSGKEFEDTIKLLRNFSDPETLHLLHAALSESARFKPVRPVAIRQASDRNQMLAFRRPELPVIVLISHMKVYLDDSKGCNLQTPCTFCVLISKDPDH